MLCRSSSISSAFLRPNARFHRWTEERLRAVLRILKRVAQSTEPARAGVILLEDLHWFDEASAAVLEVIVETAASTRTLLA